MKKKVDREAVKAFTKNAETTTEHKKRKLDLEKEIKAIRK